MFQNNFIFLLQEKNEKQTGILSDYSIKGIDQGDEDFF